MEAPPEPPFMRAKRFDWDAIHKYEATCASWSIISKEFGISWHGLWLACKKGYFIPSHPRPNRRHDWKSIQTRYDDGLTWEGLREELGVSSALITKAIKRGAFKSRTQSQANALARQKNPDAFKHSDATKAKISAHRKMFLAENPDKVPYLLNHSSKNSYPEEYFAEVFSNEGVNFVRYHRVGCMN